MIAVQDREHSLEYQGVRERESFAIIQGSNVLNYGHLGSSKLPEGSFQPQLNP
jgi:hypothetical protein